MVFQKKGPMKGKQQTPSSSAKNKKSFLEKKVDVDKLEIDSDDEISSSEEQIQKTPKGKAQSDKRVSFQIPGGKNTPGKNTPKTGISVGKKSLTPGKVTLKEFKGMMGKSTPTPNKNGKAKKVDSEDDEDEEDDDDENDDDLDMLLGDGGDDDDDDEDDDEDDDDMDDFNIGSDDEEDNEGEDDNEDDEDEETPVKSAQQIKKANIAEKSKTPSKDIAKSPIKNVEEVKVTDQTPKGTEKKAKKGLKMSPKVSPKKLDASGPVGNKTKEAGANLRWERDARTLYVGNLPKDISPTELKALSADIINVSLPHLGSASMNKRKNVFAFLEFSNETKAEENFKALEKKKLRGEPLMIDFTGNKSKRHHGATSPGKSDKPLNLKKLYVCSLPMDVTMDQIAKLFPKSCQITLCGSPSYRTALVNYFNEKDAAEGMETAKSSEILGKPVTVLYSYMKDSQTKKKRRRNKSTHKRPAKKMKFEAKQDSDDDDDDDDDDDED